MRAQHWTLTHGTDTSLAAVLEAKRVNSQLWTTGNHTTLLKRDGEPALLLFPCGETTREDCEALARQIVRALNALADQERISFARQCAHDACVPTKTGAHCPQCGTVWDDVGTDDPHVLLAGFHREAMRAL